jgi:hypothetical protein
VSHKAVARELSPPAVLVCFALGFTRPRGLIFRTMKLFHILTLVAVLGVPLASAQSDTERPQLHNLSFTPSTVNVTSAEQTVTFTLHVTDNLSGIDFTSATRLRVRLRSPSRTQTVNGAVSSRAGVITNANDILIRVTVPQFAEPGAWTVDTVSLQDNVGNESTILQPWLPLASQPLSPSSTQTRIF